MVDDSEELEFKLGDLVGIGITHDYFCKKHGNIESGYIGFQAYTKSHQWSSPNFCLKCLGELLEKTIGIVELEDGAK